MAAAVGTSGRAVGFDDNPTQRGGSNWQNRDGGRHNNNHLILNEFIEAAAGTATTAIKVLIPMAA